MIGGSAITDGPRRRRTSTTTAASRRCRPPPPKLLVVLLLLLAMRSDAVPVTTVSPSASPDLISAVVLVTRPTVTGFSGRRAVGAHDLDAVVAGRAAQRRGRDVEHVASPTP